MTTPGYTYDQAWHSERARLAGIEVLWDPGTQTLLQAGGAVAGAITKYRAMINRSTSWAHDIDFAEASA